MAHHLSPRSPRSSRESPTTTASPQWCQPAARRSRPQSTGPAAGRPSPRAPSANTAVCPARQPDLAGRGGLHHGEGRCALTGAARGPRPGRSACTGRKTRSGGRARTRGPGRVAPAPPRSRPRCRPASAAACPGQSAPRWWPRSSRPIASASVSTAVPRSVAERGLEHHRLVHVPAAGLEPAGLLDRRTARRPGQAAGRTPTARRTAGGRASPPSRPGSTSPGRVAVREQRVLADRQAVHHRFLRPDVVRQPPRNH